tara:strand:+ start:666 stop:860 length:195 start_codon:yes stop_codon:yes gene_type:complete
MLEKTSIYNMANFIIIEVPEDEIGTDILHSNKYMVQDEENMSRWFGSNLKQDCVEYIENYTISA